MTFHFRLGPDVITCRADLFQLWGILVIFPFFNFKIILPSVECVAAQEEMKAIVCRYFSEFNLYSFNLVLF